MILLSMDLNNLKLLNDSQGHAAGDKALATVSQEMLKSFSKYAKIYRTGGDEFMAIFRRSNLQTVQNYIQNFQNSLKKTEYRVACGAAEHFRHVKNILGSKGDVSSVPVVLQPE